MSVRSLQDILTEWTPAFLDARDIWSTGGILAKAAEESAEYNVAYFHYFSGREGSIGELLEEAVDAWITISNVLVVMQLNNAQAVSDMLEKKLDKLKRKIETRRKL